MKDPAPGTFAGVGLALTILIKIIAPNTACRREWPGGAAAGERDRALAAAASRQTAQCPSGRTGQYVLAGLQNSAFLGALPSSADRFDRLAALAVVAAAHALAWLVFRLAQARLGA
jgi:cobalamin synthase